jgi:hypothetical protein
MWIMSSIVSSQYHHIIWLRRCAISCLLICAFPDEIIYTMMLLIALYKIENKKCFCGSINMAKGSGYLDVVLVWYLDMATWF